VIEMGGRRLIVDGMNVIGSRPDGWWRDRRGAMRALVESLAAYVAETGDDVTVVFDARPFDLVETLPAGLRVEFAPAPARDAADDEIVRLLERDAEPQTVRVVTSDAELAARAAARGAGVLAAGAFRRLLEEGGRRA
jgi:predicted RNA-binding protein with PIN domain